jgi:hypothetical protein
MINKKKFRKQLTVSNPHLLGFDASAGEEQIVDETVSWRVELNLLQTRGRHETFDLTRLAKGESSTHQCFH